MSAPTIIALHGGGTAPALWDPVRRLIPELAFHAPDLNGAAASLRSGEGYPELVACLVEQMPAGPVVLAGATIGARLAVSIAAEMGDRLHALYLLTPLAVEEDAAFLAKLAGLRRFMIDGFSESTLQALIPVMLHRWSPRFAEASLELEALLRIGGGPEGRRLAAACTFLGPSAAELLLRIRAPIEVLYGGADPVLERAWPDSWRRIPQVRSVEVLPDGPHMLPLQIPERIAADLRRLVGA